MEASVRQPFTNLQLELLKAFSHQLSDEDLLDLKKTIADFFARRAIQAANTVWDEKGWSDQDVDRLLRTKMRTPYTKR